MTLALLAIILAAGLLFTRLVDRAGLGRGGVYALAALAGVSLAAPLRAHGPPLFDARHLTGVLALLVAPILLRSGLEVARARDWRAALAGLFDASGRVFFFGGVLYLAGTRTDLIALPSVGASVDLALPFLLAAAWALPAISPRASTSAFGVDGELSRARRLWALAFALVAFVVLAGWRASESRPVDAPPESATLAVLREAGLGLVSGVVAAVAAWLCSRGGRTALSRNVTCLASALLAVGLASLLGGSLLLAPLSGGVLLGVLPRRDPDRTRASTDDSAWATLESACGIAAVLSIGAVAATAFAPGAIVPGALVWVIGLALGALLGVLLSFGSRATSAGALVRETWGSHPGVLALAAVASGAALLAPPITSPATAAETAPPIAFVFVQVWLVATLVQGTTAGLISSRRRRATPGWQRAEGRWIALRAARDSLGKLRDDAALSDAAAEALERALERELRSVGLERDDAALSDPDIERARWTSAIKTMLRDARRAVERATADGRINDEVAESILESIVAKWRNAEAESSSTAFRLPVDGDRSDD